MMHILPTMKFFLFLIFCFNLFASNNIEDIRKLAQLRYQQSNHSKDIQKNLVIAEENTLRQNFIIQEQMNLAQLMIKKRDNKAFIDFINAKSNEQKLRFLNIMNESWRRTEVPLFEDWLTESIDVENPASPKLMLKVNTYKSLERHFDFYHYICTTMLFSKADPLLDIWDVDMTLLELVLSQIAKPIEEISADEAINILKHYLNDNNEIKTQLTYWQRYSKHFDLNLSILDFFKHLDQNHFDYQHFLCEIIDHEFARSLQGLP